MNKRPSSGTRKSNSKTVWEQVNEQAAGIDAGAAHHWVAVPEQEKGPRVMKFPTNTPGLRLLLRGKARQALSRQGEQ